MTIKAQIGRDMLSGFCILACAVLYLTCRVNFITMDAGTVVQA